MIGIGMGQRVCHKFRVRCKIGLCTLYLLSGGISVEAVGRGAVLELSWGEITGVTEKDAGVLIISWSEGGKSLGISIRTKEAHGIARQIGEISGKNVLPLQRLSRIHFYGHRQD